MRASLEREFRTEHRDIKKSLEFFCEKFDEMATKLNAIRKENEDIRAENASHTSECDTLKRRVQESEQKISQLVQYSTNRNLQFKGISESDSENAAEILENFGISINEPIAKNDIEIRHSVPTRKAHESNIVIQFFSRAKRDEVLAKARKVRLSTTDIGLTPASSVFVNEHLCPERTKLLEMTAAMKKEKKWRFVWTKNGSIFAKRIDSSHTLRVVHVSNLEEID